MRPIMNNRATILLPVKDADGNVQTDDYGRPLLTPQEVECGVDVKTQVIKGADGELKASIMEIDFPPDIQLVLGVEVEYTDSLGNLLRGSILSIQENTNFAGTRVYSRWCNIG